MDLKNVKSWEIALAATAIFMFLLFLVLAYCALTHGACGVGGGMLMFLFFILFCVSLVPLLCLKTNNPYIQKIGAGISILFGLIGFIILLSMLMGLYWVGKNLLTYSLENFVWVIINFVVVALLGFLFLAAGIHYFRKEAPKKE
jgi:hypothetical protein